MAGEIIDAFADFLKKVIAGCNNPLHFVHCVVKQDYENKN